MSSMDNNQGQRFENEQEDAVITDLRTSLNTEKKRSEDLLDTLESVQKSNLELLCDIATLDQDMRKCNDKDQRQIVTLTSSLELAKRNLEFSKHEVNELEDQHRREELEVQQRGDMLHRQIEQQQQSLTVLKNDFHMKSFQNQEILRTFRKEIALLNDICGEMLDYENTESSRCEALRAALDCKTTYSPHKVDEMQSLRHKISEMQTILEKLLLCSKEET
ncbi:uncharacterized protein LOC143466168 [Clavelina lepadiformis]|uniref:Uncharacterized protein n=1 Tax=Clavelina lepadiformis TaxID=159417 RepID=A0ABP0EV33_CLALP